MNTFEGIAPPPQGDHKTRYCKDCGYCDPRHSSPLCLINLDLVLKQPRECREIRAYYTTPYCPTWVPIGSV